MLSTPQVSSVRNRWQRIEKGRKLREDGTELKNRCHACGQPKRGHICSAKLNGGPQVELSDSPMPVGLGNADESSAAVSAPLQPPLSRTRSGSKLVPAESQPRPEMGTSYAARLPSPRQCAIPPCCHLPDRPSRLPMCDCLPASHLLPPSLEGQATTSPILPFSRISCPASCSAHNRVTCLQHGQSRPPKRPKGAHIGRGVLRSLALTPRLRTLR